MAKPKPFSDQLRAAIKADPRSCYRLAKLTGVSAPVLSRFLNHGVGLSLDAVDRLVIALGGRLVIEAVPAEPKGKSSNPKGGSRGKSQHRAKRTK